LGPIKSVLVKDFLVFLKSKVFFKQLALAFAFVTVALWLVFKWINASTNHNEFVEIPDFSGISITRLDSFVADKQLRYQIIDSLYDSKMSAGTVVAQDPETKTRVKRNRTVYLYVTSYQPKMIKMPNLIDGSLRQAVQLIESYGLKLGRQKRVPGLNCVLAQKYQGLPIAAGTLLPKGSVIDIEIGSGAGDETVGIPCLLGYKLDAALLRIAENGLAEGAVVCSDCKTKADTLSAKVYKQYPPCTKAEGVSAGSSLDVFLTNNKQLLPPDTITQ
jgi:eukaryotic-like serine/threonine-protein kinase